MMKKLLLILALLCPLLGGGAWADKNSFENKIKYTIYMATAIKAIPTLYGEDAIRFREEMEKNEEEYILREHKDRESDPFIIEMRAMLKRSGF